jgi:hypothetical protein
MFVNVLFLASLVVVAAPKQSFRPYKASQCAICPGGNSSDLSKLYYKTEIISQRLSV